MLHSSTRERILRVLLSAPRPPTSIRALASEARVDRTRAAREIGALAAAGYLDRRSLRLRRRGELLDFFALGWAPAEIPRQCFQAVERAEFWVGKIAMIAAGRKLAMALTGLAAADLLAPLVVPTSVQLYVLGPDLSKWSKHLVTAGAHPAEDRRAARLELLVWDHADYSAKVVRGVRCVALPQLYADLWSVPGPQREAALKAKGAWDV